MIIIWIIGLIFCLIMLWVLKHTTCIYYYEEVSVLKIWTASLLIIAGLIPIVGVVAGIITLGSFIVNRGFGTWVFKGEDKYSSVFMKFLEFMDKPLKL